MANPLVSVVIPAYNAAKTLKCTVDTVFGQTIQDFEILVIDDGSSDDSVTVAKAIVDPRVRVISQKNGGASSARNAGIKSAKGEYVAFLDADDLWLPTKLEKQIAILTNGSGADAVQTGAFYVNGQLDVIRIYPCSISTDPLLETLLFQNLPAVMSTVMIKRSVFDEIGYLDTSLVILEDWDLMIRLARFCLLDSIPEPLSVYRVYPGNRSKDLSIHIEPGHKVLNRLFDDPNFRDDIKQQKGKIFAAFYRMLGGGAVNIGRYAEAAKWMSLSLGADPASITEIVSVIGRRLARNREQFQPSEEFLRLIERTKASEGSMGIGVAAA